MSDSTQTTSSNSTAERMEMLLAEVAPKIFTNIWDIFGHLPRQDAGGNQKYTGLMYLRRNYGDSLQQVTHGVLLDSTKSWHTAERKINAALDFGTSIAVRDVSVPGEEIWGGGSNSEVKGEVDALTGLPELGDHTLLLALQLHSGRISRALYDARVSDSNEGIRNALRFVYLSEEKYADLVVMTERMVAEAGTLLLRKDQMVA